MNDDLAPLLSTLAEPAAPSSITASVMARIEREASAHRVEIPSPAHRRQAGDASMWLTACVGIVLVCGAVAAGWYAYGFPDLFAPQWLRGGLNAAFVGWQATLAGVLGIALCLRALFAPLRSRQG
jgi:hypothetical protein